MEEQKPGAEQAEETAQEAETASDVPEKGSSNLRQRIESIFTQEWEEVETKEETAAGGPTQETREETEEVAAEEPPQETSEEADEAPPAEKPGAGLTFGQRLTGIFRRRRRPPEEEAGETSPADLTEEELEPSGPTFIQRLTGLFLRRRRPSEEEAGEAPPADMTEEELEPSGPTLGQRLAATLAPARERVGQQVRNWIAQGNLVYVLIAILLIGALLLPPISLLQRLGLVGYTRVNVNNPTLIHPDGLSVSVDPEDEVSLRLKLESVPQVNFLEGEANLSDAVEALPQWLAPKSPYYTIQRGSRAAGPATLEVVIPNEAEPWETLDLYTWTGSEWEWLGSQLDSDQEVLIAEVDRLPSSVAVMQTAAVVPTIGTITAEAPTGDAAQVLTEALVPGLYLGTDGTLLGEAPSLEAEELEQMLLIRNWMDDEPLSPALLSDLLADPEIQETHIEAIVAKAENASGIALDYRGVDPEEREAFSDFVTALADALHEQDLRLSVLVPPPTQEDDGWESGGYDWATLGATADGLVISFPDDPDAYEDGEVESLLLWATSQVNRYKLQALVSSLSVDTDGESINYMGLEDALAPFGRVEAPGETDLEPDQEVVFSLAGRVTNIVSSEAAGTYAITYQADDDTDHTVWLGTPSFLATKLDHALRHHLRGVFVADLLDEGGMPGLMDAVTGYRAASEMPAPTELEVTWAVEGPEASIDEESVALTQPDFHWTAPPQPGTYTVSAAIAGVNRGSVQLTVAEEPTPTPTPEAVTLTEAEAACLQASFMEDVTVPDGTQFDKGETFEKTWRLRNSGTCDWPEETVLVFESGTQMDGETITVGAVAAGETTDISIELTAPDSDGNYTGVWILKVGDTKITGGTLTVVIQAGEGGVAAAPPAPGAISGSFELGGHVRNMSLPYAERMHYAGMNWAKVQVHYNSSASGWIQAAHANGFKIQLSALGTPSMVTQPNFEQDYASWVASLAADGADAIEIWNEPNISREWQEGRIDPAAYTELLCASYNAIKAANPNTLVISAAPAPTGWFGGCGPNGCDDLPFLQGMYNAGAAACMDYIGAHHNSGATSPSATSGHPADSGANHHSWYFLPQTQLYYNIFGGSRQLFYTEMGYASQEGLSTFSDAFAWARGTDNAEQAAWLTEAVQLSVQTGMVRCVIVWNTDDFTRYGHDPQDGYSIFRPGGSCPACDALHAVLGTR